MSDKGHHVPASDPIDPLPVGISTNLSHLFSPFLLPDGCHPAARAPDGCAAGLGHAARRGFRPFQGLQGASLTSRLPATKDSAPPEMQPLLQRPSWARFTLLDFPIAPMIATCLAPDQRQHNHFLTLSSNFLSVEAYYSVHLLLTRERCAAERDAGNRKRQTECGQRERSRAPSRPVAHLTVDH